jgi:uncharacterized membrane protein HdeD (DUF308 family)
MEKFKKMLPSIIMIVFEVAVAILLLADPEQFTRTVLMIFGWVLVICAAILMIRFIREMNAASKVGAPKPRMGVVTLIVAIVTFSVGSIFAFGSPMIYDITAFLLVFYGILMFVKGIFKIADYGMLKGAGYGASALRIISGIFSLIFGVLIIVNPFGTMRVVFTVTAISMLFEALLDIIALFLGVRLDNRIEVTAVELNDEDA